MRRHTRRAWAPHRVVQVSSEFGDQLDLDAGAHRNLGDAKGAAGMGTLFRAKHFGEQLTGAIGHQVLLGEVTGRVHQAHHLHDALDAVQVAAGGRMQRAQQVHGHGACGGLAFFGADVLAELRGPWLAVLARNMAGEEHQVAGLHVGHVGGRRH